MNGLHAIPREINTPRFPKWVDDRLERGIRSFLVQNTTAELRVFHGPRYRVHYRWGNREPFDVEFRDIPLDSLHSWQLNGYYCGDDAPMPWDRLEIIGG